MTGDAAMQAAWTAEAWRIVESMSAAPHDKPSLAVVALDLRAQIADTRTCVRELAEFERALLDGATWASARKRLDVILARLAPTGAVVAQPATPPEPTAPGDDGVDWSGALDGLGFERGTHRVTGETLYRQPASNRQASGSKVADPEEIRAWSARMRLAHAHVQAEYEAGLALGVPKELARVIVPVGRYSKMWASANLRNWLGFLKLRCAPNAQWEIRQYANAVAGFVKEKFPRTYDVARESTGMP